MTGVTLPEPGEVWGHYKGERYLIVGVGHDAQNGEAKVIYATMGPKPALWSRSLGEFLGYTDGHERRFELLVGL